MTNKNINHSLPKVTVLILNWNGREDTLECLASVRNLDYSNFEIVLVDNGSNDGSEDVISKQYPDIIFLQTGLNLGYAGGNNIGIRWALDHGADYVLVLNNDTIVDTHMLSHLVEAGALNAQAGLIGPTNYFYSDPTKIWTVGALMNTPPHLGYKTMGEGDESDKWNTTIEFDALVGSAMLIHKKVFESIGLFDERFFLCFEELDFCARARKAGYKCFFAPEAKIWHKVGSTLGEVASPLRTYFNVRNKRLWAKKNLPLTDRKNLLKEGFQIFSRIFFPPLKLADTDIPFAKRLLWAISTWVKSIQQNFSNPINKATLIGLRDYYMGRFGNCPESIWKLQKKC